MKNRNYKNAIYFRKISILVQTKSIKFNVTHALKLYSQVREAKLDVKI